MLPRRAAVRGVLLGLVTFHLSGWRRTFEQPGQRAPSRDSKMWRQWGQQYFMVVVGFLLDSSGTVVDPAGYTIKNRKLKESYNSVLWRLS